MATQYSQQQIITSLNSIANMPSGRHGTVSELQTYAKTVISAVFLNSDIIDLIGKWKLVWGPAVYQAPKSTVADNAMYVAQNIDDPSQVVIAISGTNPISAYGWIIEDAKINPVTPWPYSQASNKGHITQGTNVGLNVLLNTLNDNNKTLSEFLGSVVSDTHSALNITVTGHSLGGALSPVVALALLDTQGASRAQVNGWDPSTSATINVVPSAGPTPGDETWRDYFDEKLGANTDRLWNAIDIVPHAWQLSMLDNIPTLYTPEIPQSKLISALVSLAKVNSKLAGNLEQIKPTTPGLKGTVSKDASISTQDLLTMLETLLTNKLLDKLADKLGISESLLALIKDVIDAYIKHLNHKKSHHMISTSGIQHLEHSKVMELESHLSGIFNHVIDFVDFLIQAGYQHTTAYTVLLKTQEFADYVDQVKANLT